MMKRVLVIIPCYNEEASIGSLLDELESVRKDEQVISITPLIVNDCSKDNTSAIARAKGAIVVDLPVNLGIGGAVQTGFCYALRNGFDIAIQLDGDGQHPSRDIAKLCTPIISGEADVVIGSRFLEITGFQSTAMRRVGIRYFEKLIHLLTGVRVKDSTSGFRAINREVLAIVSRDYPDDYPEPESIVRLAKLGFRISEIPVEMRERQGGISSISALSSVYYMVKVTIGIIFAYIKSKPNG